MLKVKGQQCLKGSMSCLVWMFPGLTRLDQTNRTLLGPIHSVLFLDLLEASFKRKTHFKMKMKSFFSFLSSFRLFPLIFLGHISLFRNLSFHLPRLFVPRLEIELPADRWMSLNRWVAYFLPLSSTYRSVHPPDISDPSCIHQSL